MLSPLAHIHPAARLAAGVTVEPFTTIAADVENKIRSLPGVKEVYVSLVWDPPWNQAMMTEAAKLQLGLM